MSIETKTDVLGIDCLVTYYFGTKAELIRAGIASKNMFPISEKRFSRGPCISNPAKCGDWRVWLPKEEQPDHGGKWTVRFVSKIEEIVEDKKVATAIRVFLYSKQYSKW